MMNSDEHVKILYDIALSIGTSLDLPQMLNRTLHSLLKKLNCTAGGVHFFQRVFILGPSFTEIYTRPHPLDHYQPYQTARQIMVEHLQQASWTSLKQTLPLTVSVNSDEHSYVFELPHLGFLILVKKGKVLEPAMLKSLIPLMAKLANACQACLQNEALTKSRNHLLTVMAEMRATQEVLRQTAARSTAIFETMPDLMLFLNQAGDILDYKLTDAGIKHQAANHFLIKKNLAAMFPTDVVAQTLDCIDRAFTTGEIQCFEFELPTPEIAQVFEARLIVYNRHEILAILRDITKRHELDKLRDDFVSTVSHELRTPLTSMMGFLETILEGRPGPLTQIQERFLQNSYSSAERLQKLIEELLIVSRIQQGDLIPEKKFFYPAQAIRNLETVLMPLMQAKSITVQINDLWPADHSFYGDQDRLEQVMTNLLSNAIKFTPDGGQIHLYSTHTDMGWHFKVVDTGIGIPEPDLPKLFNRFYRAENAQAEQIQGTGLGLYICQAIIEAHQGQIGLESKLNQGTIAWFHLPEVDQLPGSYEDGCISQLT